MRQGLDDTRVRGIYDRAATRYDLQHAFLTAGSDERGRRALVEKAVRLGDRVLDCGGGTGSTALLAAELVGAGGSVVLADLSDGMLEVAERRAEAAGLTARLRFSAGNMTDLPFPDGSFDVVLSTYSLCPLYDPVRGAMEMLRVTKPGGRVGAAHSSEPASPALRWLADRVEDAVWRFPAVSLGCRSVSVLPALEEAGVRVLFRRTLGVPLWPFTVFVAEKPAA